VQATNVILHVMFAGTYLQMTRGGFIRLARSRVNPDPWTVLTSQLHHDQTELTNITMRTHDVTFIIYSATATPTAYIGQM